MVCWSRAVHMSFELVLDRLLLLPDLLFAAPLFESLFPRDALILLLRVFRLPLSIAKDLGEGVHLLHLPCLAL
jgi:hypothetical protein